MSKRPPFRLCHWAPSRLLLLMLLAGCHGVSEHALPGEGTFADPVVRYRKAAQLVATGITARREGNLERARDLLKRAVDIDPASGEAHHALGLVYADLGDLHQAAVKLDAAARLLRESAIPAYNLGVVLERSGSYELAMEAYEKALRRAPDHLYALENLARVRIKAGLEDEETLRLLTACIGREQRPQWLEWLNQQQLRLSHGSWSEEMMSSPIEEEKADHAGDVGASAGVEREFVAHDR